MVELRQVRDAHPRRVPVRERVVEVEERALRHVRVGERGLEPLVAGSDMVEGEVADYSHPALVGGPRQRDEPLVAAQERVDVVEGGRVVAVDGFGREDRRQVDQRRAERFDVVEPLRDPGQVSAEPLELGIHAPMRQGVPVAAHRPVGRLVLGAAGGVPVGEDLVHDRAQVPVRASAVDADDEVVVVRDVVRDWAEPVHPGEGRVAPDRPAVARDQVPDGEGGPPPDVGLGLLVDLRRHRDRLAVVRVAQVDAVRPRGLRDAQPDDGLAAELVGRLEHVRAVVMRLREQRRVRCLRDGHPFTAPPVNPSTM